jgi:hypothetical protein
VRNEPRKCSLPCAARLTGADDSFTSSVQLGSGRPWRLLTSSRRLDITRLGRHRPARLLSPLLSTAAPIRQRGGR